MHLARILYERWRSAWREVAAATLAALLAWLVAQKLFGHPHPLFAAVIAVVTPGTRYRQPPQAGVGPRSRGGDGHTGGRDRTFHLQSVNRDGDWRIRFDDDRFFIRGRTGRTNSGRRFCIAGPDSGT